MKRTDFIFSKTFCPYCWDITWHLLHTDGIFHCLLCRCQEQQPNSYVPDPRD